MKQYNHINPFVVTRTVVWKKIVWDDSFDDKKPHNMLFDRFRTALKNI